MEASLVTIVQRQEAWEKEGKELNNFYRFHCEAWKAVQDHVINSPVGECYLIHKTNIVRYPRGISPLQIKNVYYNCAGDMDKKEDTIRFCFDLMVVDENDYERDEFHIASIPAELIDKWDKAKWKNFLRRKKREFEKRMSEEAEKQLAELVKKYPQLAEKLKDEAA